MTTKQAFDQTILKFEKLVEEKKKPDWNADTCPLCEKYRNWGCRGCPFSEPSCEEWSCGNAVSKLGIYHDSYEILLMLYQIRIYLYGESDTLDFIKTRKGEK